MSHRLALNMRFLKEVLMEYVTKYPKTVSLEGDENNEIQKSLKNIEPENES